MGEAKVNRQKRERELKAYFATDEGKAEMERQRQAYLDGTALRLARTVVEEARSLARNRLVIPLLDAYSKMSVDQLLMLVERESGPAAEEARDKNNHALLERRMTLGEVANIVIAQRDKRAADVANGAKFSAESDTVADRSWRFGLAEAIARIKALTMTLDDKMRVVVPSLGEGWTQGEDMSWTHSEMREGRLFVDGEEWSAERAEAKAAADAEHERRRVESEAAIAEDQRLKALPQGSPFDADAGVVMTFDEVTEGLAAAMRRSASGEPMHFDPNSPNLRWADEDKTQLATITIPAEFFNGPSGGATSEFTLPDNPNGPTE